MMYISKSTLLLIISSLVFLSCSKTGDKEKKHSSKKINPSKPAVLADVKPKKPVLSVKKDVKKAKTTDKNNFVSDLRLFMDVVACRRKNSVSYWNRSKIINEYCKSFNKAALIFKESYLNPGRAFFRKNLKESYGKQGNKPVIYPFGGGDLATLLLLYPNSLEYTSVSLEHPGDPRRLKQLKGEELQTNLFTIGKYIRRYFYLHEHASSNLKKLEKGHIPGQLSLFAAALVLFDMEAVSLKFFKLTDDGEIHYYSEKEISKLEKTIAKRKNRVWRDTDFSVVFTNCEIKFRKKGTKEIKTYRHFAQNLKNPGFSKKTPLYRYILKRAPFFTLVKAGSYLLWYSTFSTIRELLLKNMILMVSDSTGVPPSYAKKAGFSQKTYGRYEGAFLKAPKYYDKQFIKLWENQPHRHLPFRFGYPDNHKHIHLMITRKIAK